MIASVQNVLHFFSSCETWPCFISVKHCFGSREIIVIRFIPKCPWCYILFKVLEKYSQEIVRVFSVLLSSPGPWHFGPEALPSPQRWCIRVNAGSVLRCSAQCTAGMGYGWGWMAVVFYSYQCWTPANSLQNPEGMYSQYWLEWFGRKMDAKFLK